METIPTGNMTVYPANRLEDLAVLIDAVLQLKPGSLLEPGVVIVESKGMQHWLSMELAHSNGVCMNLSFPMPGNFIWQLVRKILGPDQLPTHSPYQREAMVWRIDHLLVQQRDVLPDEVNGYWQDQDGRADRLKRFQLASKLADLYEQYMLFRRDWIDQWESGAEADNWQAILWRELVKADSDHPIRYLRKAVSRLADHRDKLPSQVCLFAINTLPEIYLEFINELARHTQVHLFHLNPCVEYWGNIQTEKGLAAQGLRQRQSQQWLEHDEEAGEVGNPLLANLGVQGKEFFRALQGLDSFEISAFEMEVEAPKTTVDQPSVLNQLQQDILLLRDGRSEPRSMHDDSINFSSSHSALRELQALHDWLLHQFNNDKTLTPRDVLVMCPQVEDYAPYVGAVFDGGKSYPVSDQVPRLPCSITDRSPKDSEPLIGSFLDLLTLPDSRFQVSLILDFLRLPALQRKFGLTTDELSTIEWWLSEACVHWGLDGEHKQQFTGQEQASEMHSWSWGLRRLLLGFAQGDREQIAGELLLLPHVDGEGAVTLGRLMQVLERLNIHTAELKRPRTGSEWGSYLKYLHDAFFQSAAQNDDADAVLTDAIEQLTAWTGRVGYEEKIPLEVVRYYLSRQLGLPDESSRYMTGQITICSMTPMRSTPFRIIAILGLNDGQYPRISVPIGFDLMAQQPRRPGDRSRRGDDRYLFLEALISAREKLYLSYQGADIKNNSPRQPSLVLTELMDYLQQGYGWSFDAKDGDQCRLKQQPLHPFSPDNFRDENAGFDSRWLELGATREDCNNLIVLDPPEQQIEHLDIEQLVRFFDNPARVFAESRLGLHLYDDEIELDDAESFDADGLTAYQAREKLVLAELEPRTELSKDEVLLAVSLSGHLPDSRMKEARLTEWEQVAEAVTEAIVEQGGESIDPEPITLPIGGVTLSANLPWVDGEDRLLLWKPGSRREKDEMRLWLFHLCASAQSDGAVSTGGVFIKKGPEIDVDSVELPPVSDPMEKLEKVVALYLRGLNEPLPLNARLGLSLLKNEYNTRGKIPSLKPVDDGRRQDHWHAQWHSDNDHGAALDAYVRWFWQEAPELEQWWPDIEAVYRPALESLIGYQQEEQS